MTTYNSHFYILDDYPEISGSLTPPPVTVNVTGTATYFVDDMGATNTNHSLPSYGMEIDGATVTRAIYNSATTSVGQNQSYGLSDGSTLSSTSNDDDNSTSIMFFELSDGRALMLITDPDTAGVLGDRSILDEVEASGETITSVTTAPMVFSGGDNDGQSWTTVGNLFANSATVGPPSDFVVSGTAGDDLIDAAYTGDPEGDVVDGLDHSDGSNDDVIEAGAGNDTVYGGSGNDTIYGGDDADEIDGGLGDDLLVGGAGNDTIIGSDGTDTIDGGVGSDTYLVDDAVPTTAASYRFVGTEASDGAGTVSSAGDVDGDGLDDLLIGAYGADGGGSSSGESYLITGADLAAADAADGTVDGVIDLDNVNEQSSSYQFIGTEASDGAGTVSSAGDVDGDGLDDLLIGATGADGGGSGSGESYLITGADLAAADAADGTLDGVIDLDNVNEQSTSYQFIGTQFGDGAGIVSSAGDVDGDGLDDLLIGAYGADGGGSSSGESYLITGADLAAADAADGTVDGVIDLDNVNEQSSSYQFIGETAADTAGFSLSSAGDVDGDGLDDLLIGAFQGDGGGLNSGESYLISGADLAAADAADGTADGVIELYNVNGQSTSYQFIGTQAGDNSARSVSSAGDVDGDGLDDLLIGAYAADGGGDSSGESYLISGADLAAADAADGTVDGVIDLDNVNEQSTSYQFIGTQASDFAGLSVSSAGDVDGDGLDDLLIGATYADGGGSNSGEAYLITGADLAAADAADGTVDGVIDLDNVNEQSTSYQFIGANAGDRAAEVTSAGDVDGDGLDDLLIGAYGADGGGSSSGESYLISGANLEEADAADGIVDGVINLGNVAGLSEPAVAPSETVTVTVDDTGAGSVVKEDAGTTDTVTSVETFIAAEGAAEADEITLSTTVTDSSTITGLDDTAVGTYTPDSGDPVVNFGPGEAVQLSDLLALSSTNGTFQITSGDETGQIGDISFENFETINFDVACFAAGTLIRTDRGNVAIENLQADDMVETIDNGLQPIRWIGSALVDKIDLALKPKLKPIRIRAGAIAEGCPANDLLVSPQHRMLVRSKIAQRMFDTDEVLIAANKLLCIDGIDIAEDVTEVEYFHMLFDRHEVIWANETPSESLFTGPEAMKSVSPQARMEIAELFPKILEPDFVLSSARYIPAKGKHAKILAHRHMKNRQPLLQA